MSTTRIGVSASVDASPSEVFRIVSDPKMHVEIDGSGMLETAPGATPIVGVGESFVMNMDRVPLGDLPMGKYQVLCTTTQVIPDKLFEWNVGTEERGTIGHLYGWEIAPDGAGSTITNYCDWSGTPDSYHVRFPIVPVSMIQKSVDNLVALLDSAH